ncbi:MAG: hypothetical protein H0U17_07380 [Actinobacteria bacterium]|nr:hypothetical protein [Actinomycetota bacterium]
MRLPIRQTHHRVAFAAGIHPKVVSERLGHPTVPFTMDVDSHAIPSMEAEAAENTWTEMRDSASANRWFGAGPRKSKGPSPGPLELQG